MLQQNRIAFTSSYVRHTAHIFSSDIGVSNVSQWESHLHDQGEFLHNSCMDNVVVTV